MKWLRKLIKPKEEINERELEAFYNEQRIFNIRRRIEDQRIRLGYTQTRPSVTRTDGKVSSEAPSVGTAREEKEAELQDLKAKLLGKKK